jgi:hypothetical protein
VLTAYKNELSCAGGPSFYGNLFKKTPGGSVYDTVYGYCGSLSFSGLNDTTNWWCSNLTANYQLGSCWFTRHI